MQAAILLEILSAPVSKAKVDDLAKKLVEHKFPVSELIDLTFHKEEQIGFRASWILENLYIGSTFYFWPQAKYFLERFHQQNNLSSRRHFGKILALMTSKKAHFYITEVIQTYKTDTIVEVVFSWLIDDDVPVAVKSHCLNILANLSWKHDWIKEELVETMDFLVDRESIAFYAKAKQIRKQLIARIKQ
ncbi:hypothetical protein [Pedobacter insulae]|uniref:DNA alkylation repair enzyme n=1 Tax=Pedobacter insulae TaxID=414048 RepID=A0A1I2UG26_9SPHI|nr:hypothetical protein [Pedobacter insulae]SFG75998.1 hypothetical protein SAMN04489864_102139 [Pedobacter insulae]